MFRVAVDNFYEAGAKGGGSCTLIPKENKLHEAPQSLLGKRGDFGEELFVLFILTFRIGGGKMGV